MEVLDNYIKVYSGNRTYKYTASVQHQGKVIAFAMTEQCQIHYTILELDDKDDKTDQSNPATTNPTTTANLPKNNAVDVNRWTSTPKFLQFPQEIAEVGYSIIKPFVMPTVSKNGQTIAPNRSIAASEIDPFASSTARLSADAPFQVLSDNTFIYLFRQSTAATQTQSQINGTAIVDSSLLLDRFVLVGDTLQCKQEIRYQRSRHKTEPAGDKDSLSAKDMEGRLFYEPTQEIKFVGQIKAGRFAILRLPTQINEVKRWQFFVYNDTTKNIESINVEQSEDGLFDTRGSRTDAMVSRSFKFEGRSIATGLSALMYFQQENTISGYDNLSKPMKQNARVMLAVATQAANTDKAAITVLDFAVSKAGQLTQIPNSSITLPNVATDNQQSVQLEKVLEKIAELQGTQRQLVGDIGALNDRIALLQPSVERRPLLGSDRDKLIPELAQLRDQQTRVSSQRNAQQEIVNRQQTKQYTIIVKTGGGPFQETGQPIYLRLAGDLAISEYLNLGPQWTLNVVNTYQLKGECGVPQQVELCYGTNVEDPWYVAELTIIHSTLEGDTVYGCEANRWLNRSDKRIAVLNVSGADRDFDDARDRLRELDYQLDGLNQAVNGKQTRLSDLQTTIANIDQLVAEYYDRVSQRTTKQDELKAIELTLKQQQASALGDVQLSMPLIGIDADGLTLSGAVLGDFAWTKDTPLLFDSATGQVMLYFRGVNDQFFALYYNTLTAKAMFRVPTQKDGEFLDCIARATDADLDQITIKISDGDSPDRATVSLTSNTVSETWKAVPRESQQFANILNGTANVAGYIGEIATVAINPSNSRALDFTLIQPARQTLTPEGAIVSGRHSFTLDQPVSLGQVQVNVLIDTTIAPPTIPAGSLIAVQLSDRIERIGVLAQELAQSDWQLVKLPDPDQSPTQLFAPIAIISSLVQPLAIESVLQIMPSNALTSGNSELTVKTLLNTTLGQNTFTVNLPEAATAESQSLGIRVVSPQGETLLQPRQLLQYLPYDYDRHYRNTLPDQQTSTAPCSRLIAVSPMQTSQPIVNAPKVTRSSETPNCQWVALSPGKTILFDGTTPAPTLTEANKLDQLGIKDSLTLETWVKPSLVKGTQPILSYAQAGRSSYALGVIAEKNAAVRFDGQTHVQLPETTLNLSQGLTLEAWVYYDRFQRWGRVFDLSNAGFADVLVLGNQASNNALSFELSRSNQWILKLVAPNVLTAGKWMHVAVTLDPSGIAQLYLDGKPLPNGRATCTVPQGMITRTNNRIGRDTNAGADNAQPWMGAIDEARIWTKARSATEIAASMNQRLTGSEPNLYGYWCGTTQMNNQLRDRTPAQRHGTIQGTVATAPPALNLYRFYSQIAGKTLQASATFACGTWNHIAAAFQQSYAVQLQNNDAYIDCGNNTTLNLTQDLTIEAFLRFGDIGRPQGILSKGRIGIPDTADQSYATSYSFHVEPDGKLCFSFERSNRERVSFLSTQAPGLEKLGQFCQVAVTRKVKTKTLDDKGNPLPNPIQTFEVQFYVDGNPIAVDQLSQPGSEIGSSNQPLLIGKAAVGSNTAFRGAIAELRLWTTQRLQADIGKPIQGREQGLIAWWRFEENAGTEARDAIGNNHGTLKGGCAWTTSPDPNAASLLLYGNGTLLPTTSISPLPTLPNNQLVLGATTAATDSNVFQGLLEDTRIWQVCRTSEQILDNLFRRLVGEQEQLLAYYTFDPKSNDRLSDLSGRNNHLKFSANPSYLISDAPISQDTPQVRSALASIRTAYHDVIHSTPAVQEYADVQLDSDANQIAVYKRCYSLIQSGEWHLITGFKVGNLVTEWVGQVQFEPQIIGYIEGAPPVPSENLTVQENYSAATAISLIEAEEASYSYSSSVSRSLESAIEASVKAGVDTGVSAGGVVSAQVLKAKFLFGLRTQIEISYGNTTTNNQESRKTLSKLSKLTLEGRREDPQTLVNAEIGQRFVPANVGFALVQSETADVFALRLEHNHALVSFQILPNLDIPKDWNIITFPLNPNYVKQGTLDGKVGLKPDPDYPNATAYSSDSSYFKPIAAYQLKNKIRRQEEQLKTQYDQYDTRLGISQGLPNLEKRNMVNTYVWTSEGGFFAETQEVMDVYQETSSSQFRFKGLGGITNTLEMFFGPPGLGFAAEFSAMLGGQVVKTVTKTQSSSTAFSLNVEVNGERNIYDPKRSNDKQPGKVDAYRFMTFYLQPQEEHFEQFFAQVVDPIWLAQSSDASAIALRQAQTKGAAKKPPCWRVFHRVTYVSRVLPLFPEPSLPPLEKTLVTLPNINSNYELIKQLDPLVGNRKGSRADLSTAIEQVLQTKFPELLPHQSEIVNFMANYYNLA
jgi:hypothetical protein